MSTSLFPEWEQQHATEIAQAERYPARIHGMWRKFGKTDARLCGDCKHCLKFDYHNRRYYKCDLYGMSHGGATDWRISWPACGKFEAKS